MFPLSSRQINRQTGSHRGSSQRRVRKETEERVDAISIHTSSLLPRLFAVFLFPRLPLLPHPFFLIDRSASTMERIGTHRRMFRLMNGVLQTRTSRTSIEISDRLDRGRITARTNHGNNTRIDGRQCLIEIHSDTYKYLASL